MAESYAEKEAKLINEVVDVFERNDADILEMFRVLDIIAKAAKQYIIERFGERFESIVSELEGESE